MEDRLFKYAVLISLVLHCGLFAYFYLGKSAQMIMEKQTKLEYQKSEEKEISPEVYAKLIRAMAPSVPQYQEVEPLIGDPSGSFDVPMPVFKDEVSSIGDIAVYERKPDKIKGIKVTREVEIPMLKSEKINTPAYATYYQIVRDRIRDRAYANYTKLSMGEIFVSFVINADGSLAALQVLEQKSEANDFLRRVALKSVEEAAPFPVFTRDLNYPELTFNVQISFQYRATE